MTKPPTTIAAFGLGNLAAPTGTARPVPPEPPRRCARCGPWQCYAGSGLFCVHCSAPLPGGWTARCLAGYRP